MDNQNVPGKGAATGALVLGIVGLVIALFINGPVGLVAGIVGLVMASKAKKEGFSGGIQTAGFVLSILAVVFGALGLVACIACTAAGIGLGLMGAM